MDDVRTHARRAGLLIPLFACASRASWGVGEIGDLGTMAAWLAGAGQRVLQLLPINEMAPEQQSPYSAISAMAIDPLFISVPSVPEFAAIGGEASLDRDDRFLLEEVRRSAAIQYPLIRSLKQKALAVAFDRFVDAHWRPGTARAQRFNDFAAREAWWLDDYGIFRALHRREGERPWTTWPEALRACDPAAVGRARHELQREVLFLQYQQWIAASQWSAARRAAAGVRVFGDIPFMVSGDSVDVWRHQQQFDLDASVGAPPDEFSAEGQNWGTPVYRWDVVEADDFRWLRARARRAADLFDGYRIDHLVGFYRTYAWPKDGSEPLFTPAEETDQQALGKRVLDVFREATVEIIAEDLGTVPDFVRASLAELGIPGFRVLRWERHWKALGQPYRDPSEYPPLSVAASGTHDTETLSEWWNGLPISERALIAALPTILRITGGRDIAASAYGPEIGATLIEALNASGSDLLLMPIQDVFGWTDRINDPSVIDDHNWTFRLPWPCDRWDEQPQARQCQAMLRRLAEQYGRLVLPR